MFQDNGLAKASQDFVRYGWTALRGKTGQKWLERSFGAAVTAAADNVDNQVARVDNRTPTRVTRERSRGESPACR
jgi:hypothetical protein